MAKRIGIVGTRFTELHSPEWKSQLQSIIDSLPNDVEIFVNGDICIVQRVYPTREDSQEVRLFTKDRPIRITNITKWDMEGTNPW